MGTSSPYFYIRGVFIEDYVYSVSGTGVAVHRTNAVDAGALEDLLLIDPDDQDNNPYWGFYGNYAYCW